MRKLILIDSDGRMTSYDESTTLSSILRLIQRIEIELIVAGEVDEIGGVVWEKQFKAVTVMPSSFGKEAKS